MKKLLRGIDKFADNNIRIRDLRVVYTIEYTDVIETFILTRTHLSNAGTITESVVRHSHGEVFESLSPLPPRKDLYMVPLAKKDTSRTMAITDGIRTCGNRFLPLPSGS